MGWDITGMGHNGTVPQGLGHKGTGTQRDWDTMGLGHMAGPQQYRSTMGLGHNGTGTKRDRSTTGLGHNGTGPQWDWDAQDRPLYIRTFSAGCTYVDRIDFVLSLQ